MLSASEQLSHLLRGASEVKGAETLEAALRGRRPVVAKLGIDPTAPELHLGHAVVLQKLRQFQDFGHQAVLIIGDATAAVGDPSGRDATRPMLSESQIQENVRRLRTQIGKVLLTRDDRLEVAYNSQWFHDAEFEELLGMFSVVTVQQLLQRDTFRKRMENGQPISLQEMIYPVMQAWDSVEVNATVELGGQDQLFNCMLGRDVMQAKGMQPQTVLLMPILTGIDGSQKMSKSLNNHVPLAGDPYDMYGRVMSVPDALLPQWCRLLFDAEANTADPFATKKRLAYEIVARFHSADLAEGAADRFDRVFSKREQPDDVAKVAFASHPRLLDVLTASGMASSRTQARKLIEGGGVRVNGEKIGDPNHVVDLEISPVVQVGRRQFVKVEQG